ncbi:MAG: hypothetical protein NWE94_02065 [Candidatus Bathyarchaeota archaeon]|nr:hypothetical protein [Candidatus Bathyarchaeota archaeon]
MNQKTLVIAVVAIIVVAAVVAGVYLATQGGGGATPTPSPSATPTVADATSLQFSVEITGGDAAGTYTFKAKNIGQSSMKIRIDISSGGVDLVYIVNGEKEKAWVYMSGTWTESDFATDWDAWGTTLTDYKESLADWTGTGDYTYTENGTTVRIYNITVNPSLADSLFETS